MKKPILAALFIIICSVAVFAKTSARIKDICYIKGIRKNQLKGFGLVVGLDGNGDSTRNPLTKATLENFFDSLGIKVEDEKYQTKNVAVVMISADVDGFIMEGDNIDVQVASVGDAKSLKNGMLLQTPLKGADGKTYAVAQGSLVTPSGKDSSQTVGVIPGGAIVEQQIISDFFNTNNSTITLILNRPDFKTMENISVALQDEFGSSLQVKVPDSKRIVVGLPNEYKANLIGFISKLEELEVETDSKAKVVINERSGIVVMGEEVKVSAVGISVAGLKLEVSDDPYGLEDEKDANKSYDSSTDVKSIVDNLNDLGVDVKDIIQILIALKDAGAINAEIVVK